MFEQLSCILSAMWFLYCGQWACFDNCSLFTCGRQKHRHIVGASPSLLCYFSSFVECVWATVASSMRIIIPLAMYAIFTRNNLYETTGWRPIDVAEWVCYQNIVHWGHMHAKLTKLNYNFARRGQEKAIGEPCRIHTEAMCIQWKLNRLCNASSIQRWPESIVNRSILSNKTNK